MQRLIRILFAIADWLAWLIVIFNLFAAIAYPFMAPIFAEMDHEPLQRSEIVTIVILCLVMAASGYAFTKRRVFAVFALLAPGIWVLAQGFMLPGLFYCLFIFLFFALPFILAYFDLHAKHAERYGN